MMTNYERASNLLINLEKEHRNVVYRENAFGYALQLISTSLLTLAAMLMLFYADWKDSQRGGMV